MNLSNAPERARNVKGIESAARLYADIEYELALGEPSFDDEHHGENALAILEDNWPGVKDRADDKLEAGTHTPALSSRALKNIGGAGDTSSETVAGTAGHASPAASRGAGARHDPGRAPAARGAIHARRSIRARARDAGSVWRQTGIPAVSSGSGGLGLQALGALLGLSLAYLLLSPKGSGAFSTLLGGITTGVNAFAAPTDPFAKRAAASSSSSSPFALNIPPARPGARPANSVGPALLRGATG